MPECPSPVFQRRLLTNVLLDELTAALAPSGTLVGDAVAPEAGGWSGGQPGSGSFVPYLVLTSGHGTQAQNHLATFYDEWLVSYTVGCHGGNRDQCEYVADQSRYVLPALRAQNLDIGEQMWHLAQVSYTSWGNVRRTDATSPPYFSSDDSVSLKLLRTRTTGSATIPLAALGG